MTPLQQTALDFCRECLGWEMATESMWGQCSNRMVVLKRGRTVVKRLRYSDLNAVVEAVRGWCSENDLFISTCTMPTLKAVSAQVFRHDVRVEVEHSDFTHALLAACVAANRQLKGISHD